VLLDRAGNRSRWPDGWRLPPTEQDFRSHAAAFVDEVVSRQKPLGQCLSLSHPELSQADLNRAVREQILGTVLLRLREDQGIEPAEILGRVYERLLESEVRIVAEGRTSRRMAFTVHKVVEASRDPATPSRAEVLDPPVLVLRASGTCVTPLSCQRKEIRS